ncbi:protein-glutamate O-methyltransferase CheR [Pseudoduganella sp. LjRoot289]|uniref:CheR family methyltransferase n=1 Tax=Pseudoduganella sp. LjRoot289 TaxID=3342314 RepID=UPI003ECDA6E4
MSAQAMLRRVTGLTVSKSAADRAIRQRMEQTGLVNREEYLAALTPQELTELVELVVVPESWLFRDQQAFHVAVELVRAMLARPAASQRPVRILSVPCAGGEEPYSMAMALCDAGVPRTAFSIDAYDLSPGCVARARSGVYGRNAFRARDLAFRDRYFTPVGNDDYQIAAALRAQVRFSQGNLLTLVTAHRVYDIIFCRNLLIYFDKPATKAAIERLSALLADDGVLFAGYAEVPSFAQNGFTPLPHRQAFALKKKPAAATAAGVATGRSAAAAHTPPAKPRGAERGGGTPGPREDGTQVQPARSRASAPSASAERRKAERDAALTPGATHGGGPAATPTDMRGPARPGLAGAVAAGAGAGAGGATLPAGRGTAAGGAKAPPSAADLLAQARKLADLGKYKEAAAACQAVLAAAPDSADAYFILGMLSEHAGQAEQAEQQWRRCVYLQPDHYEALCHLALLAEHAGDSGGAATLKARAARIYQRQQTGAGNPRAEP